MKPKIINLLPAEPLGQQKNYKENLRKFRILSHDDFHVKMVGQRVAKY